MVISGFIADRRAPWILAIVSIAFVLPHYTYAPRLLITGEGAVKFDLLQYDQETFGWWGMINRDMALILFAAFFSWVGALSVDKALLRADRSDEIATLLAREAQKEKEHTEALGGFVEELMAAFAAQHNGQQRYLATRPPKDQFSRYIHFINNHLHRNSQLLEQSRQQQALWSRDQLAQAIDALYQHVTLVEQGKLGLRSLAPDMLPLATRGVEKLSTCFYRLLCRAVAEARGSRPYEPGGGTASAWSGPL